jgi:acetyl-CoA carboxylase biotin carboxyl carrier protein
MKPKEIQDLLEYIAKSGMAEVNIETEGLKLHVKRNAIPEAITTQMASSIVATPVVQTQTIVPTLIEKSEVAANPQPSAKDSGSNNYITIKSPMIGTFYRASSPETPAFVNVGDEIKAGKIVCIIEAMKLFNEIESDVTGRIVKVLVDNMTPVEYDQPLFLVEPL